MKWVFEGMSKINSCIVAEHKTGTLSRSCRNMNVPSTREGVCALMDDSTHLVINVPREPLDEALVIPPSVS